MSLEPFFPLQFLISCFVNNNNMATLRIYEVIMVLALLNGMLHKVGCYYIYKKQSFFGVFL
jgi:hypothetical protein